MKNFYGHTNESLRAIVAGLKVSKQDRVLSICGSGDQAFALVEHAGEVVVVDRNKDQINYAKRRLEALRDGNYDDFFPLFDDKDFPMIKDEKFLRPSTLEQRLRYLHFMAAVKSMEPGVASWSGSVRYFLGEDIPFLKIPYGCFYDNKRILKIKENLDAMSFLHDDIAKVLGRDRNFSRVYLSNAVMGWQLREPQDRFLETFDVLPKGCLLYTANTRTETIDFPSSWELEVDLSTKAREAEQSWYPKVYRKIA